MIYQKNLPGWERALRLLASVLTGLCALRFGATPVGITFGVASATALLTAFFGFCPACALAGRRIDAARKSSK